MTTVSDKFRLFLWTWALYQRFVVVNAEETKGFTSMSRDTYLSTSTRFGSTASTLLMTMPKLWDNETSRSSTQKQPKFFYTKYYIPTTSNDLEASLQVSNTNKGNYGYPFSDTSTTSTTSTSCDGFSTFAQDLSLISLIFSVLSFIIGLISLIISNFYNVFGSGLSLLIVGLPSFVINVLTLLGAGPSSSSPIVTILTAKSTVDTLNNLFNVVPGSLFSDLLALISLVLGKVSIGLSSFTTYPKLLEKILDRIGVKDLIDNNYACNRLNVSAFVYNIFGVY